MSEAGGKWGVRGLVEGVRVPVWSWVATLRGNLGVRARGPRRRAVEGGGEGTGERGSRDSGTDARAHNGPKRRQGDPTEQREGEREEGRGSAPTGGRDVPKTSDSYHKSNILV
jgi:hypothetical protein